jgi:hypothetical protein
VSVAVLAGASSAAAAPAATARATGECWRSVVNDWLGHHGRVVGTYAIPCYTQAIQHLNAYPDVRSYSTATEDIQRALLAAIRQDRGNGPGAGPGPGGISDSNPGGGTKGPSGGGGGGGGGGFLGGLSPSNATAIPLPLLVLGGLALLLLAAAGATLVARRVQARRGRPAPPHRPAVDKRS